MSCIQCEPVCGQATGSTVPTPVAQGASAVGILGTLFGVFGKLSSVASVPWWGQALILILALLFVGLGIAALIWLTAYDQCTEEPYVLNGDGPQKTKGVNKCIAGAVSQVQTDFTGPSMSWLAPWTASHDRIDVVVTSKFWDIVESNMADVFCTDDVAGRNSEYMRCYFYTDKVCKAATGSAIGATIGFILVLPLAIFMAGLIISAAATCTTGIAAEAVAAGATASVIVAAAGGVSAASGAVLLVFCAVFCAAIVAALLLCAFVVLAAAWLGGMIGLAASSAAPPTGPGTNHPALSNSKIQEKDLVSLNGKMVIKEESDEIFHTLRVNVFWWVGSASLIGNVPENISSNPFSYCDLNDLFYVPGVNEAGQPIVVSLDGCSEFTNIIPSRCR